MEIATVEVHLIVVTSLAAVVAAEEVAKIIEATVEASRAIETAFKAIVAAKEVVLVADEEEASLFLFTPDLPATASSCKFQAPPRTFL